MSTETSIEKSACRGPSPSNRTRKEVVSSFRQGHISVDLKLVTPYDEAAGRYLRPIPKVVFLVDDRYVRMPVDGHLIRSLGEFLTDLGKIIEGIDLPERRVDVPMVIDRIMEAMQADP